MLVDWILSLKQAARHAVHLLGSWLDHHLINIVFILIGAWLIRKFGTTIINRILQRTVRADLYLTKADREKRLRTLNSMAGAFVRAAVYVVAGILIVGEVNPSSMTALFASAGLIGVGVGFGAQSLIKDFISGIFIISENQYRVGDFVNIGGASGTVEDVTIRTTILRDINGDLHHVPNGSIVVTTNKTIGFGKINEEIIVARDTDLGQLEHLINHVGEAMAASTEYKNKILRPIHFASISGFAAHGINVIVVGRTTPNDKWAVRSEFLRLLKDAFEKHHIELASSPLVLPVAKKK